MPVRVLVYEWCWEEVLLAREQRAVYVTRGGFFFVSASFSYISPWWHGHCFRLQSSREINYNLMILIYIG